MRQSAVVLGILIVAYLYRIVGPTPKVYIGVTAQSLAARFRGHCGSDTLIGRAIRKYGKSKFSIEALVVGTPNYVNELEEKAIELFGTRCPSGYNLDGGGKAEHRHASTRKKLSLQKLELEKDPEYRAAKSAATRKQWQTGRDKLMEGLIRAWRDPERCRRHKIAMLKHWEKRRGKK